ncbi:unnamed protein product [Camellia sinensis]
MPIDLAVRLRRRQSSPFLIHLGIFFQLISVKVTIDVEQNCVSVYNNGDGVPVEIHQEEGVYVPEMIFGHLLTSSNYDDLTKKTTGGRNGYGAKLTNIFSTEFVIETADGKRQKKYKQDTVRKEAATITAVFPSPKDVMSILVQRVLEQRLTTLLDKLLIKPSLVNPPTMEEGGLLLYLRMLAVAYEKTQELARELHAVGCGDLDVEGYEFLKKVTKSGIVESLLSWANFKQSKDLKKTDGTKRQRITGITKLEDANDVGGKSSDKCTLILTEGVSAKALANVLGIILGGGVGTRLYPLTKKRKPAVPLGANYHLIDIPVSNCLNSNISKIYVLTQFNSASVNRHLSRAYASNMGGYKNEGFVEVLAAQQSPENPDWFQGPQYVCTTFWTFVCTNCSGVHLPSMLLVQGALPNLSAPTALLQTADTHSSHLMQPQASSYGSIPPSQIPSSGMSPSPGAFMGQQFPNNMPFPSRLCHRKPLLTVTGKYPGPTIAVHEGDNVVVKVTNLAARNTTIHCREVKKGGEGNRSELVEPHLVPYIITALMYTKLGTEGRKDLFD